MSPIDPITEQAILDDEHLTQQLILKNQHKNYLMTREKPNLFPWEF